MAENVIANFAELSQKVDDIDLDLENQKDNTVSGSLANRIKSVEDKDGFIVGTLVTGQTSLTLYNSKFVEGAVYDVYNDAGWNVLNASNVVVATGGGALTLTYPVQTKNITVKVKVN